MNPLDWLIDDAVVNDAVSTPKPLSCATSIQTDIIGKFVVPTRKEFRSHSNSDNANTVDFHSPATVSGSQSKAASSCTSVSDYEERLRTTLDPLRSPTYTFISRRESKDLSATISYPSTPSKISGQLNSSMPTSSNSFADNCSLTTNIAATSVTGTLRRSDRTTKKLKVQPGDLDEAENRINYISPLGADPLVRRSPRKISQSLRKIRPSPSKRESTKENNRIASHARIH